MADKTETILASISPEHRARVIKAAADESITVKIWLERAIEQQSTSRREGLDETASETLLENRAEGRADAGRGASKKAAAGRYADAAESSDRSRRPHAAARSTAHHDVEREGVEEEAVEIEEEEVDVHRGPRERGPAAHAGARSHHLPGERAEDEISAYHSRLAKRAAAAEEMPRYIWLEQAILEHSRRHERETAPPRLGPAPPESRPAPPSSPAASAGVWESVRHGRGGDLLGGLLLGVILVLLLLLILPWIGAGCWGRAAAAPASIINTVYVPLAPAPASTTPAPPTPPINPPAVPSSVPNVTVTTLVNSNYPAPSRHTWIHHRRPRPRPDRVIIVERRDYDEDYDCGCYGPADDRGSD